MQSYNLVSLPKTLSCKELVLFGANFSIRIANPFANPAAIPNAFPGPMIEKGMSPKEPGALHKIGLRMKNNLHMVKVVKGSDWQYHVPTDHFLHDLVIPYLESELPANLPRVEFVFPVTW